MLNLEQNLILALLIMVIHTVLFWTLYTILGYKENTRQEIISFPFKIFKMEFFRLQIVQKQHEVYESILLN